MFRDRNEIYLGTIEFPFLVNEVRVIDPCYDPETIYRPEDLTTLEFLGGRYECFAVISDEGSWGKRVASLRIERQDAHINYCEEIVGTGVDSGQAGFFLKDNYDTKVSDDAWYKKVCDITLSSPDCGLVDDWGVVASSGYGDGQYNCYLSKDGEYCNGAELIFIDEAEDEDDYDD